MCDLDDGRIADVDAAGIDVLLLLISPPGLEQLEQPKPGSLPVKNDRLARAVRQRPRSLAGFAALPTAAPDTAADELKRIVREYGFKRACTNGHMRGRYLDDSFFWPILERAESLIVPPNLHPTFPPKPVISASYIGNFAPGVTRGLAMAAWGWHIETAIHVLRLVLSRRSIDTGLQLVIGHLGEALPFMLRRLDCGLPPHLTKLDRPISAYLHEHVHYTVGGLNYTAAFLNLLFEVGVDRIMFSADCL